MRASEVIAGRQVVVCAGPGGVGKTTTAAALALGAARRGARACVVTIDPARRLAQSLGLEQLGNEPLRVERRRLRRGGVLAEGELWALMLDPKRTFDELVARHAPDERTREAVLGNRIYGELSRAVAGSQEYMAAERLYELHTGGGFDLIVLDTPPARNALDFLDAPGRLARFVDSRSLRFFLGAGGAGARIAGATTAPLAAALRRVTGVDLLSDLSEFFSVFGPMAGGFAQRAQAVEELLAAGGTTAFVVVTSPSAEAVEEALALGEELVNRDLPLAGVIANRVHRNAAGAVDASAFAEVAGDPDLAHRLAEGAADQRALAERDAASLARLTEAIGTVPAIVVPHLRGDVHDIAGVAAVEELLEA